MTKYKLVIKLDSDDATEVIHNIFSETAEDWGMRVETLEVIPTRRTGRPRKSTQKIDLWLEKRHKPFSCTTFADYLGVSRSAAWRRLEGLVRAGVYVKVSDKFGKVMYHRPDNLSG